jgi:hypothetical protein
VEYKIPKRFSLLGHEYSVEIVKDLYENHDCYGDADPELKRIRLQSTGTVIRNIKGTKKTPDLKVEVTITTEDQVETFFHEIIHIVLYSIGEEKLYRDERFVSLLGRCLMEIEKTKN